MPPAHPTARTLVIHSTMSWPEPLRQSLAAGLTPHTLRVAAAGAASNLLPSGRDELVRVADVVFGQPHPDDILASNTLRLVQLSSAGYTRYDHDGFRDALRSRGIALCTASAVYDEPCAQHALAFILAGVRMLPQAWLKPGTWDTKPLRADCRLLNGQNVLLVGYGAIARRLVELLAPFHMNLTGVRRTIRGDENVAMRRTDEIDAVLPDADHVVNILPASDATRGFFDRDRLQRIKPGAVFYNIGRGDTVDQVALGFCLREGRLRAAFLDVTTPEPLPPEHPLWSTPNCFITPHTAGGHQGEGARLVGHLVENVRRLLEGKPLLNRVI